MPEPDRKAVWERLLRPLPPAWVGSFDGERIKVLPEGPITGLSRRQTPRLDALFFGRLANRDALGRALDLDPDEACSDADLFHAAYEHWGDGALPRLEGRFALVCWDRAGSRLLLARDPLGGMPLFHASARGARYFSPSTRALRDLPEIRAGVDRATLLSFITFTFLSEDETPFEGIRRVPVCHALRVEAGNERTFRYWDPSPAATGGWVAKDDLGQFSDLLAQAVGRALKEGPAAIYLSGGLDSVSVAAYAAEAAKSAGQPAPLALSLIFPHRDTTEEPIQRSVAQQLGMPQRIERVDEATAPYNLVEGMLALSGAASAPLVNFWRPAYLPLAVAAADQGWQSVLNGSGGDEWLTVSPYLAADLLHRGDLAGVGRLLRTYLRSSSVSPLALTRMIVWDYGARPLVGRWGGQALGRVAPAYLRRRRLGHWFSKPPNWVAPDPDLRQALRERFEEAVDGKLYHQSDDSFYIRDVRQSLEHPLMSWDREEDYEFGARSGLTIRSPYWDSSLVAFLFRVHPDDLSPDARSKGLVRRTLAASFPQLGFERQRKVSATGFYRERIGPDLLKAWDDMGGAQALDRAGVVDANRLGQLLRGRDGEKEPLIQYWQLTHILTCEAWLRHN